MRVKLYYSRKDMIGDAKPGTTMSKPKLSDWTKHKGPIIIVVDCVLIGVSD